MTNQSKEIGEVRKDILEWFKETNSRDGCILDAKDLVILSMGWNPKQKDASEDSVNELIKDGLIEKVEKGLSLTKNGFDHIY